jgi:hypothetical protein
MNDWGPLTENGYTGVPKNLINGLIYTLDNRRLYAYQQAGRTSIPVKWVDTDVVFKFRWKFTTQDGGLSVILLGN